MKKAAVFLERDGILNLVRFADRRQIVPCTFRDFIVNSQILPSLQRLKEAGFMLIVTTNQPAISSGELSRAELDKMHQFLRTTFPLDQIMVCPHSDDCSCRKPKPGMLFEARSSYLVELVHSFVVTDKGSDAEFARTGGCTSVLIKSHFTAQGQGNLFVENFEEAVQKILLISGKNPKK